MFEKNENKQKEAGVGPFLKKIGSQLRSFHLYHLQQKCLILFVPDRPLRFIFCPLFTNMDIFFHGRAQRPECILWPLNVPTRLRPGTNTIKGFCHDSQGLISQGKYHYIADLMLDWIGVKQPSKYVVIVYVAIQLKTNCRSLNFPYEVSSVTR